MDTTTQTPAAGATILIETKPFVDSDKLFVNECRFLSATPHIWWVERKPGSRHAVPVSTIREWVAL